MAQTLTIWPGGRTLRNNIWGCEFSVSTMLTRNDSFIP
jgi:hypothetical protein